MVPKPSFLGPRYGSVFQDPSVAAVYHTRPPYPVAVFEILARLIGERSGAALDVGCGTGIIARHLVNHAERVDAVDISTAMIAEGQRLPGGDHPRLRWIVGRAEDAPLEGPYTLATAAASLHWMDWDVVLPRLHDLLTPDGLLVVVLDDQLPPPWRAELAPILSRYSTNQEYQIGFKLIPELAARGLFEIHQQRRTDPVPFRQSLEEYVESYHARSGFSRDRMDPAAAAEFDRIVTDLVGRYTGDTVDLQIVSDVAWGRPLRP